MGDHIHTIPEILQFRAENNRDTKVFSFYDKTGLVCQLEPQEIYKLAGRFAHCLREWGFQPGDVLANGVPNSPERIVTDLGILMAGCVVTNLQVVEKDGSDFWNNARISQCKGLIVPNKKDNVGHKLVASSLPSKSTNSGIYDVKIQLAPSVKKVVLCNRISGDKQNSLLEFLRGRDEKQTLQATVTPSSLAVLFCTSGSSGFSKLVPKSHETILESGRKFRAAQDAIYYTDRPMGWIGGFPFEFLAFAGRRVTQDCFDGKDTQEPEGRWNIISSGGCTGAALCPSAVYELVDHFKSKPPQYKLKFITSSGQAMKKELMDAIGLLSHAVIVSYGSTEGGIFAAEAITNASQFKDFYCGKVLADVEIKLINADGNPVKIGEEGEIILKCDRLTKSYYNAETASSGSSNGQSDHSKVFMPDGWFRTGDRGILHSDKSLFCYGRTGDVVSIGPTLVYLSWPENILFKCPDLLNSSVVGIEDKSNGNVKLVACVVPKTGKKNLVEKKIIEFFDENVSSGQKFQLKLSHVFFMDELPMLPTGKVNKKDLVQFAKEKLKIK